MAQRQNDTVVKSTRCVTLTQRVRMAQRHNDTVCLFGTVTKRHGASLWHGGSLWNSDKMTRCVNLTQRQNDTVRHFGTVCHFGTEGHFGTAIKCLSFFFSNFILGV